uniref:Uncharacterized protein n=1 Tax=Anguilla anguilla TaxID=7936 RepID=A0A0E9VF10_ANGAN
MARATCHMICHMVTEGKGLHCKYQYLSQTLYLFKLCKRQSRGDLIEDFIFILTK